jgi:hypothetical protein
MDRYERAAQQAANAVRRSLELKPARGLRPGWIGAWECPIARTVSAGTELECRATPVVIEVYDGESEDAWPALMPSTDAARFMERFDTHRYAPLEESG